MADHRKNAAIFIAGEAALGIGFLLLLLFADGPIRLVGLLGLLTYAVMATRLVYVFIAGRRLRSRLGWP